MRARKGTKWGGCGWAAVLEGALQVDRDDVGRRAAVWTIPKIEVATGG